VHGRACLLGQLQQWQEWIAKRGSRSPRRGSRNSINPRIRQLHVRLTANTHSQNGSRSRSPRGYALCVRRGCSAWDCDSPLTARSFSRDFKKKGMIPLSTYLKQYKVGDIVDVVANGTPQMGKRSAAVS
jgi:hypothetical protein